MSKQINIPLVSASFYIAFQIIANVLSTKIALLPLLGLAVDGGTIIYPLTFTLRDFVHKTCGKSNSRQVVVIAALLSAISALLFWVVGLIPADPSWPWQDAYEKILTPVARVAVASVVAQTLSELVDTEVFSVIYRKLSDVQAVLASNGAALVVDSLVFVSIAFIGVLPWVAVLQIIISNILIKAAVSLVIAPSVRLIPRLVKPEEI